MSERPRIAVIEDGPPIDRRRLLRWGAAGGTLAVLGAAGCRPRADAPPADTPAATTVETDDADARIAEWIAAYDAQGIHRTGTEGDAASANWLAERARALGLEPALEELPFERLDTRAAFVELPAEAAPVVLEGVPLYDAPPTGPEGVRGVLGDFGSPASIGFGAVGPHPSYSPEYFAARAAARQRAHLAITGGEAFGLRPGYSLANAEHWRAPMGPPTLQLPSTALDEVTAAAGREVRVVIDTTRTETIVHNVTVTVAGARADLEPLVVMTPRSGWWRCASERGGGIALWLELLRAFARERPQRSVHFVASTGHELGHYGLDHYLEQRQPLIGGAAAWIHLGANFAAAVAPEVRLQASSPELLARARDAMAQEGAPPDVETAAGDRPLGEARNIFDGGGRYVSLLGRNGLFHNPDDRWPEAVDVERTVRLSRAFLGLARELASEGR